MKSLKTKPKSIPPKMMSAKWEEDERELDERLAALVAAEQA